MIKWKKSKSGSVDSKDYRFEIIMQDFRYFLIDNYNEKCHGPFDHQKYAKQEAEKLLT